MTKRSSVEDDVLGWLASNGADQVANYANRGRLHGGLSNDELSSMWVESYRKMAANPKDLTERAVTNDLESEFELRAVEPPYDLVREEINAYSALAVAAMEAIEAEDPERYEDISNELEADIKAFKKNRDDSKS